MKLKLRIHVSDISLCIHFVFGSSGISTPVALATLSSHKLIMGKVEIGNFCCLIGDISIIFLQKCLLSSPPCFIRLLS